ncbi:VOC family protein [Dehalococcoidia bacterium]|nr:VOC family protein [Dehalococcoidia bacterium]
MGLSLAWPRSDNLHALFRLPSGQDFEVFGPRSRWHSLQAYLVLGFEVTDISTVQRELEAQGVEFVSEIVEASGWGTFCYFRGPDGYLYELVQRYPVTNVPSPKMILGYSWIGLLTLNYAKAVRFFAEVIGLPLESHHKVNQTATFRLPSGQLLEVFGPRKAPSEYRYMRGPCLGFRVKNIRTTFQEMLSLGVKFVTETKQAPNGNARIYFLGPDKQLYAVQ